MGCFGGGEYCISGLVGFRWVWDWLGGFKGLSWDRLVLFGGFMVMKLCLGCVFLVEPPRKLAVLLLPLNKPTKRGTLKKEHPQMFGFRIGWVF